MEVKTRRKMTEKEDDPMDDITVDGGNLSGWIEKPFMSETDMYRREIAEMQKTNHTLMVRIKEQGEEIEKLKEKIDANLIILKTLILEKNLKRLCPCQREKFLEKIHI